MSAESFPFHTPRLLVRGATEGDAPFILSLWGDARVTRFVGFPIGIPTAPEDALRRIRTGKGLNALLIAERRETREAIGQCMLGAPDEHGVCEPDIKLAPNHWGHGLGRELWTALIGQLFETTDCAVVRGTPNVANTASIRMMEAAGMRRVGQGVFTFPESMQAYTEPVPHVVYEVTRDEWLARWRSA